MVLTALILICSVAVSPDLGECTRRNAITEMRVLSEFENPILCLMHAEGYLAGTSFGQELNSSDRVKIICVHSDATAASVDKLSLRAAESVIEGKEI
jgi:hypothetical protein